MLLFTCDFYYLFWSYFIILIIIHFLGIELNTYLGYLFFYC